MRRARRSSTFLARASVLAAGVAVLWVGPSACALFVDDVPCSGDVHCPQPLRCGVDGFCGASGGPRSDAGGDDGIEAGALIDAGQARADAGTVVDGGPATDGGARLDAGRTDGGVAADAGLADDAGFVDDAGFADDAGFTDDAGFADDAGFVQGPTCVELYGALAGFVACSETETSCEFTVFTSAFDPATCRSVCGASNHECLGATDDAEACTPATGIDDCDTVRGSEMCVCSR